MVAWIVLAVLAAFGVLSVMWALFGFLLPGQRGTVMVYMCQGSEETEPVLRHYGWLRDMGFIRCPLLLVECGITEAERTRLLSLRQDVEICTMEELPSKLEQERIKLG